MRDFYIPSREIVSKINSSGDWCASYSGGKDSTSLVTWIEYLRRTGQVVAPWPKLVQSDTLVEYPALQTISRDMMDLLRSSGWECAVVEPLIHEKLYCRILGIGNSPIHAGIRKMRWCTRSTKIDPMERWRDVHANGMTLTGVRIGESAIRDEKIKKPSCAAGGECGIPEMSERTYSPIINWTLCQVVDWLNGAVDKKAQEVMGDVFVITKRLTEVYDIRMGQETFGFGDPEVKAARFGCIGCPAISAERHAPLSVIKRHGADSPICELYDVWFEARQRRNRCYRPGKPKGGRSALGGFGPIKLEVRKTLLARVLDIQSRAGIVLVTPEDEAFIRKCWDEKVYPRGWSEADELTEAPSETPLFEKKKCVSLPLAS